MAITALVKMVNDMIYKEEHILFPMALETLSEEDWAKVRKGEEEVGYAWIKPETQWKATAESFQQSLLAEKIGSLNLDTGQLTPEQVNLMLTHLPIDISFVNEQDEVAYYSASPERIFPRSPGVIGRKVQNCHPPKSMAIGAEDPGCVPSREKRAGRFLDPDAGEIPPDQIFCCAGRGGQVPRLPGSEPGRDGDQEARRPETIA